MKSTWIKVVIVLMVIVGHLAFYAWLHQRRNDRAALPPRMQKWQPFAERSPEERAEASETLFTLDKFDVQPLTPDSEAIAIPRPVDWYEQMIIAAGEPENMPTTAEEVTYADVVWRGATIRGELMSITLAHYETGPAEDPDNESEQDKSEQGETEQELPAEADPEADPLLIRITERLVSRDWYVARYGSPKTISRLIEAGRYYLNVQENTLDKVEKAIMTDDDASINYTSEVPHWLLPLRELALGESWEQSGAISPVASEGDPRPTTTRTLNRLVLFEGRRAAEIASSSTFYDYSPAHDPSPLRHTEESLMYVDLETGEPLWFERTDTDHRGFEVLIRGCNQIFKKQLIYIQPKKT